MSERVLMRRRRWRRGRGGARYVIDGWGARAEIRARGWMAWRESRSGGRAPADTCALRIYPSGPVWLAGRRRCEHVCERNLHMARLVRHWNYARALRSPKERVCILQQWRQRHK
jgi:hypothetical protein